MSSSLGAPLLQGWQKCLIAALLGVASHSLHYVKGHREPQVIFIASVHFFLAPLVSITITTSKNLDFDSILASS
jgi:hypothetical protein